MEEYALNMIGEEENDITLTQMNHNIGDTYASACQIWQPLLVTMGQFPTCFSFKHQRICWDCQVTPPPTLHPVIFNGKRGVANRG